MAGSRAGTNEVNMADVAARAGVSTASVSRALRGAPGVSAATRERVRAIADELAYVVSPAASALSGKATRTVAVVVPRIDIWFYSAMLASVESTLAEAGVDVLVYQVDGESQRRAFFQDLPARRKVDAVVMIALPVLAGEVDRIDLLGVTVVVAGGRIGDHPHVEVDDRAAARLAVRHLRDLGHRRIAMIRTSDTDGAVWSADLLRTRGFLETMAAAGLDVPDDHLVTEPFGVHAGARALDRLLDLERRPTAVFCYSDEIAVSALSTAVRRGLSVPGDLSLVGVDGLPLAEPLGITTVDQRVDVQGRWAAEQALAAMRGETPMMSRLVSCELVVRTSTGPPSG